ERGATLFMVLLAAWEALLHRASGEPDFAVGSPVDGRDRTEVEGMLGLFVNTLVLRGRVEASEPFPALLARARETALAAYAPTPAAGGARVGRLGPPGPAVGDPGRGPAEPQRPRQESALPGDALLPARGHGAGGPAGALGAPPRLRPRGVAGRPRPLGRGDR